MPSKKASQSVQTVRCAIHPHLWTHIALCQQKVFHPPTSMDTHRALPAESLPSTHIYGHTLSSASRKSSIHPHLWTHLELCQHKVFHPPTSMDTLGALPAESLPSTHIYGHTWSSANRKSSIHPHLWTHTELCQQKVFHPPTSMDTLGALPAESLPSTHIYGHTWSSCQQKVFHPPTIYGHTWSSASRKSSISVVTVPSLSHSQQEHGPSIANYQ